MAETKMQLVDWLDDLCVRFIINLPHEELTSVERICFQIEEAQWFYEDFIRAQDPSMPAINLKRFCEIIWAHCPVLAPFASSAQMAYQEFLLYKTRVPVRGAIMLNADMTHVVLVKGWKKNAKWSFPRGKINKDENDLVCAIREVYEETGYDVEEAGLVKEVEEENKFLTQTLQQQEMRLYVFRNVPMDTHFEPRTRKEISAINWFKISDLAATGKHPQQQAGPIEPNALKSSHFYMVTPFIRQLRAQINKWRKEDARIQSQRLQAAHSAAVEEAPPVPTPVYEDGMMTTDAEDEGHFQKLVSGLGIPKQAVTAQENAPPAPLAPAANPADLSLQLKQMLSIGSAPAAAPASQPQGGISLMNHLMPNRQAPGANLPPHTPMEQVTATPPMAQTPHGYHHPRPPPAYSEMPPPPNFPLPTQGMHGPPVPPHGVPAHWQGAGMQPFHGQLPSHMVQHQGGQPMGPRPPPQGQPRGLFGGNIPAPPPHVMQNQYGEPSFGSPQYPQNVQSPPQQPPPQQAQQPPPQPAPQPAAKPPQKLTSHALNLLNTLKSPNTQAAQPSAPSSTQPQQHTPSHHLPELADHPPLPPDQRPLLPSQILGGPMEDLHARAISPQIHQPMAQKSKDAQQESLLNLFRSVATPAAPTQGRGLPPPQQTAGGEPVELSAQPSPHMPRDVAKPVQHKLSMRRMSHLAASKPVVKQSPDLTSATVSGPLNAPDFETVKKNQPSQRPVELGNGVISPAVEQSGFPPNQRQHVASPPVPVHNVGQNVAMEAPQPFLPTGILRKSAQDIQQMAQVQGQAVPPAQTQAQVQNPLVAAAAALAPRETRPPSNQQQTVPQAQSQAQQKASAAQPQQQWKQLANFDRRGEAPQEQKNALLSLFGGATTASPPAFRQPSAGTGKGSPARLAEFPGSLPVSALPGRTHSGHASLGNASISGITSPVSPLPSHSMLPLGGASGNVSRQNTVEGGAYGMGMPGLGHQGFPRGETPRSSRISSINSIPGGITGDVGPTNPTGSAGAPAAAGGSGAGTPAAPTSVPLGSQRQTPSQQLPPHMQIPIQGQQMSSQLPPLGGQPLGQMPMASTSGVHLPNINPMQQSSQGIKRTGSIASDGIGSGGAQSPITPVEKSFLLNYLQGVGKEGQKRSAAQGQQGQGGGGGGMR